MHFTLVSRAVLALNIIILAVCSLPISHHVEIDFGRPPLLLLLGAKLGRQIRELAHELCRHLLDEGRNSCGLTLVLLT